MIDKCPICDKILEMTKHHLYPKSIQGSKWFRNHCSTDDKIKYLFLCRNCHNALHKLFTEKELGREYNSIDKIMAMEKMINYKKWAMKQKYREVV